MRTLKLKSMLKLLAGIIIVVIMSVSFSGFTVIIEGLSNVVCKVFVLNNPLTDTSTVDDISLTERICTYIYNGLSPLNEVLCEAALNYSGNVSVGEISQKVGNNNFLLTSHVINENDEVTGDVDILYGDRYQENGQQVSGANTEQPSKETLSKRVADNTFIINKLKQSMDTDYLIKNFYVVDSTTSIKKSNFNVKSMLEKDFSVQKTKEPQILIYHTHAASEAFRDSSKGAAEQSIVGVGDYLTKVLTERYGYNVYHDRTAYDMIDGKIDRSLAYAKALPSLKRILADNPSIQVVIDLHRDGVRANVNTVTTVNNKQTAQIMLFNGLSRTSKGAIKYLKNNNLSENLAFSLQLKINAMKLYPDFAKPIYLKGYRYNLHLVPRSLLIELGSQNNTFSEACNAAEPLAEILDSVLSGK